MTQIFAIEFKETLDYHDPNYYRRCRYFRHYKYPYYCNFGPFLLLSISWINLRDDFWFVSCHVSIFKRQDESFYYIDINNRIIIKQRMFSDLNRNAIKTFSSIMYIWFGLSCSSLFTGIKGILFAKNQIFRNFWDLNVCKELASKFC